MTHLPKLTPKQWTILKLFIISEGAAIEDYKLNSHRKQKKAFPVLSPDHFYSYPDDIVKRLTTQVRTNQEDKESYDSGIDGCYVKDIEAVKKPTAGKACRTFVELGIFEVKKREVSQISARLNKISQPNKTPTDKSGQETIQYFLKSDFETFKTVLLFLKQNCDAYERVEMLSHPYFRNIITEDLVRTILFEKQVSIISKIDIFDWAPNEIPKVLAIFDEKKEGIFINFEKEIQDEIRERETVRFYADHEASDWVFSVPCNILGYEIPIFPEGMPIEEKLEILREKYPPWDITNKNLNDAITCFPSVLNNHFKIIEQEQLILPILGLIQSSPMALVEFILGKWESFKLPHGLFHKKNESFNNPLFMRLVSLAISDMASTLKIPGNKNVDSFELMEFSNKLTIDGEYCQDDGLLRIGLTRGYDIYYDMGYSTRDRKYPPSLFPTIEEKTPSPNKFWVKIRVRQVSPFFIRKTEIKDVTLLFTLLRGKSQISNHIRGKLSNRMQNLLLRYENNAPTSVFTTYLVEEINRALLSEDFYEAKAFAEVKISLKTQEIIERYYRYIDDYDDSTGSNFGKLLHRNRSLLDDAFPEAIARYGEVQYPIRKEPVEPSEKRKKKK